MDWEWLLISFLKIHKFLLCVNVLSLLLYPSPHVLVKKVEVRICNIYQKELIYLRKKK